MRILSSILDFIFPRQCHVCGESLPRNVDYICASCLSHMPRTLYHRVADNPMERRFMGQFPFRAATGHFFYSKDSEIAVIIHDLKYRKFRGLARHMGRIVAQELITTGFLSDIDIILPAPMHFMKKARRGYNQTEEISVGISDVTGIRIAYNLKAVKSHRSQTSMTLEQRLLNVEGVFKVINPEELDGKKILIVDDVCTTGSTLSAISTVLVASVKNVEITLLTLGVTF